MRPKIVFVADAETGMRHRAFSQHQASFCGRVGIMGTEWANVYTEPSKNTRHDCQECADSNLNGEVKLVNQHYIPVSKIK